MAYYNVDKNGTISKGTGWAMDLANLFTMNPMGSTSDPGKLNSSNNTDIAKYIRNTYGSKYSFLNGLSDTELGSLLDSYWNSGTDWNNNIDLLGNSQHSLDLDSLLADWDQMQNANVKMPDQLNYDDIYNNAQNTIKSEDQGLLDLLTKSGNQEINSINKNYNDYAKQVLSNDYMKNSALMGTAQSEMSKARQSALEAGASAGFRLASNINTLLSTQNQQQSQSLETANNLASMLLNQQNAASSARQGYVNNQVGIKQGQAGRIMDYTNNSINQQQNLYDAKMSNYEDQMASQYGNNPWNEAYTKYQKGNSYKNSNGGY